MTKPYVLITLLLLILWGCQSDSGSDDPHNPVGPTKTLDVPGTYQTIQAAIDDADNGDIVRVAAGRYTENLVVDSKDISLRGAGIEQTIISGAVYINKSSETSFEGFTVQDGGLHVRESSVRISGNALTASPIAGLWLESCDNAVISDNAISDNAKEGILVDDSNGVIGSNTITHNATDGVVINNASPTLQNNTIFSNGRDGISVRGFTYYAAPLLLANRIHDNGGASNYDIICFGADTNPTGSGNLFGDCINCAECDTFGNPITYMD